MCNCSISDVDVIFNINTMITHLLTWPSCHLLPMLCTKEKKGRERGRGEREGGERGREGSTRLHFHYPTLLHFHYPTLLHFHYPTLLHFHYPTLLHFHYPTLIHFHYPTLLYFQATNCPTREPSRHWSSGRSFSTQTWSP